MLLQLHLENLAEHLIEMMGLPEEDACRQGYMACYMDKVAHPLCLPECRHLSLTDGADALPPGWGEKRGLRDVCREEPGSPLLPDQAPLYKHL